MAGCHPRSTFPSRWRSRSRRWEDRQWPADKSARYGGRRPTSFPIEPTPSRIRKWRSYTWDGPPSWPRRVPRTAIVLAPTKNRTRLLWSGSARSTGCNRIDFKIFLSFCILTNVANQVYGLIEVHFLHEGRAHLHSLTYGEAVIITGSNYVHWSRFFLRSPAPRLSTFVFIHLFSYYYYYYLLSYLIIISDIISMSRKLFSTLIGNILL